MTKTERLKMIKEAHARLIFKKRQAANAATVRRWTDEVERPRRAKKEAEFDAMIESLDENHNHWTDAPKYAETHYGDVARNTLREWDE